MRVTPPLSRGVLIAASEPSVKLARIFDLLVAAFDTMPVSAAQVQWRRFS
jgi:hypothetical protein